MPLVILRRTLTVPVSVGPVQSTDNGHRMPQTTGSPAKTCRSRKRLSEVLSLRRFVYCGCPSRSSGFTLFPLKGSSERRDDHCHIFQPNPDGRWQKGGYPFDDTEIPHCQWSKRSDERKFRLRRTSPLPLIRRMESHSTRGAVDIAAVCACFRIALRHWRDSIDRGVGTAHHRIGELTAAGLEKRLAEHPPL